MRLPRVISSPMITAPIVRLSFAAWAICVRSLAYVIVLNFLLYILHTWHTPAKQHSLR
jgi:hypothetical protein